MFQKLLGNERIDWSKNKIEKLEQILENEGCKKREIKEKNIKMKISEILKLTKKGNLPEINDLEIIYNNTDKLDHFDCVRTDQILTIIANNRETDFQWGSICMNKKWKNL